MAPIPTSFWNANPAANPSTKTTPSYREQGLEKAKRVREIRSCQAKPLTHSEAGSISILPLLSPYQTSPCFLLGLSSKQGHWRKRGREKESQEKEGEERTDSLTGVMEVMEELTMLSPNKGKASQADGPNLDSQLKAGTKIHEIWQPSLLLPPPQIIVGCWGSACLLPLDFKSELLQGAGSDPPLPGGKRPCCSSSFLLYGRGEGQQTTNVGASEIRRKESGEWGLGSAVGKGGGMRWDEEEEERKAWEKTARQAEKQCCKRR